MKIAKDFIETKRLELKKAELQDYKLLYKNFWSDKNAWKYMLWRPVKNLTEAKAKIKEFIEKQQNSPRFLIFEKKSKMPIGIASIILRDDESVKDFAIGMGTKFTGQGYGFEISKALIKYSFEILDQDEIFTSCMVEDTHTYLLQKKLGLKERGISSKSYTRNWDGKPYSKCKFTLSREEYLAMVKKEKGLLGIFKKKV